MKKRVLSLLLVLIMVMSFVPISALADKSGNEIKQQISSTYAIARSQNGGSFNGWCGAYVNYQLKILGINSYLESGGNGRDQFDYYKNKSKSSGGYSISPYSSSKYSLSSALNAITKHGSSVYNILVGFERGWGDDGKLCGHALFIHAIIDGNVYYSECFNGTYGSEGTPIVCGISTFASRYGSPYTFDGAIYFGTKNTSITVTFDANGGVCSTSTKSINKGSSVGGLPTASRSNYTFDGWYTASNGGTKVTTSTTFSTNVTLYAHWTKNAANIKLYGEDGNSVWYSTSVEFGSSYTLPADYPKKNGYYFCGWAYNNGENMYDFRPGDRISVAENVILYPIYVSHSNAVSGQTVFIYNIVDFTDSSYDIASKTVPVYKATVSGSWSSWSEYKTTPVSESDTVQVRTAKLYRYYYFLCPYCGAHEPFSGTSDCGKQIPADGSAWRQTWSTVPYANSNYKAFSYTKNKYYTTSLGDGQLWCFSAGNLNDTSVGTTDSDSGSKVIVTGYSYREYIETIITDTVYKTGYVLTPKAHSHSYTQVVVTPTCTERGYTTYTCSVCGDSYKGSYVDPLGHNYKNGTCTRCGVKDPNYKPQANFSDVADGSYCYDAVQWAVANGITNGTDAMHFSPNAGCTRGQVVTFLWRAAGEPTVSGNVGFVDVAPGSYCYEAVKWAVAKGITKGTDATHFSPNATCTRGQVVTFMYRAESEPAVGGSNGFVDVAAGSYCYNAVQWAVANGITKGTDATHFSPSATCTRGQVVTFLYRAE